MENIVLSVLQFKIHRYRIHGVATAIGYVDYEVEPEVKNGYFPSLNSKEGILQDLQCAKFMTINEVTYAMNTVTKIEYLGFKHGSCLMLTTPKARTFYTLDQLPIVNNEE